DETQPSLAKEKAIDIITTEITEEEKEWGNFKCIDCIVTDGESTVVNRHNVIFFITKIRDQHILNLSNVTAKINRTIDSIGTENYIQLEKEYVNEALMMVVKNKLESEKLIVDNGQIYRNDNPIFNIPTNVSFLGSHFYSPYKKLFGMKMTTFQANIIVIWIMSLITYILLYFDVF